MLKMRNTKHAHFEFDDYNLKLTYITKINFTWAL